MAESGRDVVAKQLCKMLCEPSVQHDWQVHRREAYTIIAALDAAGLAVVPKVATFTMIEAAGVVQRRWEVMLAAAPKP